MTKQKNEDVSPPGYDDLRDRAFEVLAQHEQKEHGGAACLAERINLIAWLCHCLGISADVASSHIFAVFHRLQQYGGEHEHREDH